MTSKEICEMCNEYSIRHRCSHRKECKIQKLLADNKMLRKKNRELKARVEKLEYDKSWDDCPDMMGK